MSQGSPQFQIRGIPAVILAVLILTVFGVRTWVARSSLSDAGLTTIQSYYATEYQRYQLEREDLSPEELRELLNAARDLEVASISARGSHSDLIVKVQLVPNDAQPPGSSNVRYCQMSYSSLTGWEMPRDVRSWSYRTKLF